MSLALDPTSIDAPTVPPEQRLFLGVILNAAMEAAGNSRMLDRNGDRAKARVQSLAWFKEAGEDFQTVCNLAGVEPERVQSGVLAYVNKVAADPGDAISVRRTRARSDRGAKRSPRHSVTMRDVAIHAGVSTQTVARVLDHHPSVARDTRERVEQSIKLLGYDSAISRRSAHLVH